MGRPLRIDAPGAWHHVMNRGAGRRTVFKSDLVHSASVERDAHLDWLFRYINANPLELGWDRPLAENARPANQQLVNGARASA